MTRLRSHMAALRSEGRHGLIPFITAGDPDLETTGKIMHMLAMAGVDAIELGIPYTDPLADGPVIQRSSERALKSGATLEGVFELVGELPLFPSSPPALSAAEGLPLCPLLLMTYYNPVLQYGHDRFAARCAECGVDGIIATDLPPEEADDWVKSARRHEVDTVFLLAPTSTDERVALVSELSTGFVYCVSRLGVTGARDALPADLTDLLARIRRHTDKPIAVGFGIATADHVRQILSGTEADAVVVGSALVDRLSQTNLRSAEGLREIADWVGELKQATG